MHNRNFGSAELDVDLHKLKVRHWYLARESWIRGLQIQQAFVWSLKRRIGDKLFSRLTRCWTTCSVIKHACACGQKDHSCSSIPLQWHRNQDIGRLGVTSNVLGNALKKRISCLVKFRIAEALDGASSRCRQGVTGTPRQLHWYERSAHLVRCANRLNITFVVPILHCSVCDDVKTVSDGRGNTFLEVDGRFQQMSGMPSHACGREQFLPKPTCFPEVRRRRSAQAETCISRA